MLVTGQLDHKLRGMWNNVFLTHKKDEVAEAKKSMEEIYQALLAKKKPSPKSSSFVHVNQLGDSSFDSPSLVNSASQMTTAQVSPSDAHAVRSALAGMDYQLPHDLCQNTEDHPERPSPPISPALSELLRKEICAASDAITSKAAEEFAALNMTSGLADSESGIATQLAIPVFSLHTQTFASASTVAPTLSKLLESNTAGTSAELSSNTEQVTDQQQTMPNQSSPSAPVGTASAVPCFNVTKDFSDSVKSPETSFPPSSATDLNEPIASLEAQTHLGKNVQNTAEVLTNSFVSDSNVVAGMDREVSRSTVDSVEGVGLKIPGLDNKLEVEKGKEGELEADEMMQLEFENAEERHEGPSLFQEELNINRDNDETGVDQIKLNEEEMEVPFGCEEGKDLVDSCPALEQVLVNERNVEEQEKRLLYFPVTPILHENVAVEGKIVPKEMKDVKEEKEYAIMPQEAVKGVLTEMQAVQEERGEEVIVDNNKEEEVRRVGEPFVPKLLMSHDLQQPQVCTTDTSEVHAWTTIEGGCGFAITDKLEGHIHLPSNSEEQIPAMQHVRLPDEALGEDHTCSDLQGEVRKPGQAHKEAEVQVLRKEDTEQEVPSGEGSSTCLTADVLHGEYEDAFEPQEESIEEEAVSAEDDMEMQNKVDLEEDEDYDEEDLKTVLPSDPPSPTSSCSSKAPGEEVPLVTRRKVGRPRKRALNRKPVRLPNKEGEAVRRDEAGSDVGSLEEVRSELDMLDMEPGASESEDGSSVHNNPRAQSTCLSDSVPNSPASSQFSVGNEDTEALQAQKIWKKSIMLVWRAAANHKYANVFLQPVTNDIAPGYHSIVHRPMDLSTIKKNIENGAIRTTADFQRDIMLMFQNAIMYNSSDHDVFHMAIEMQRDVMEHIQQFLATQLIMQTSDSSVGAKALRGRDPTKKQDSAEKDSTTMASPAFLLSLFDVGTRGRRSAIEADLKMKNQTPEDEEAAEAKIRLMEERHQGKRASNERFVRLLDKGQEREAVRRDEARSDVGNIEEGRRELHIEPRVSKDGSSVHNNPRTQSTFSSLSVPNSSALSPFSIGSEHREALLQAQQVWKRRMMSVWHAAESHKNANIFLNRITNFASSYHFKVRKPMTLWTIKKNIKNGEIHTIADFKRDIMVMFTNAILYNSSDHAVIQRSMEMQRDVNKLIKLFMQTSFSSLGEKVLRSRDLNRRRTSPRSQTPEDEEAAEAKIRLMEERHQAAKHTSVEHLHQPLDSFNPALRSPSQLAAVQELQSELPSPMRSGSLKAPVEEDEVPLVTQRNAGCSRKRASNGRFVGLLDKGQEREAVRRDEARSDVGNIEEGRRELHIEPRVSKDGSSVHNNPSTQSTFTSLSVPNSSSSSPL
uniref:Bromodomain-containing protein 8 n=1 Tax=Eptatretus burgeri TaxID=7764 RepID=A0A8C4N602_EPTBU